jgi:hypothetical protein
VTPAARVNAVVAVLAAAASMLAGCEDGTPPTRAFGSRQLLALRDSQLAFEGVWDNRVLYVTGTDHLRFWSIDVDSAEIREHDIDFADVPAPGVGAGTSSNTRYACSWSGLNNVYQLVVLDKQTMQETTIAGIADVIQTRCPTEADPTLSLWRRDDSGAIVLWTGPFDALQPAPLDVAIVASRAVRWTSQATYVLASAPGDRLDALGLYGIELTTFAVTPIIPALLADAAWAPGSTPGNTLESSTLTYRTNAPGGSPWSRLGDRFIYERAMSDGSVSVFTGPFDPPGAREIALFQVRAGVGMTAIGPSFVGTTGDSSTPQLLAWRQYDDTGANQLLHVWHDQQRRLVSCPLAGRSDIAVQATRDRRRLLAFPRPGNADVSSADAKGPVVLVSPEAAGTDGSGGCVELASGQAATAGFSRDDTALFWLLRPAPEGSDDELWTAASDGSGPRLLGRDDIRFAQFTGPSQLEVGIGADLAWLDVHVDPVDLHYLADDIFGPPIGLRRWLITGYQLNDQDGTGILGIVNRDMEDHRPISPEVARYISPDRDASGYVPSDRPARVVYQVHGRNPSAQDGLWVATINGAELP